MAVPAEGLLLTIPLHTKMAKKGKARRRARAKKRPARESKASKQAAAAFKKYAALISRKGTRTAKDDYDQLPKPFLDMMPGDSIPCGASYKYHKSALNKIRHICFECCTHFRTIDSKISHMLTSHGQDASTQICRVCLCPTKAPKFHRHDVSCSIRDLLDQAQTDTDNSSSSDDSGTDSSIYSDEYSESDKSCCWEQGESSSAVHLSDSAEATTIELEKIDKLFYIYADASTDSIDPAGIDNLCFSLGLDSTDLRIILLAWKSQAEYQGFFTLQEWRTGLKTLGVDSLRSLKKALHDLLIEVRGPSDFLDFYSYAFQYYMTDIELKCVDVESACELLDLVFGYQFGQQVDKFTEYLKSQTQLLVIKIDEYLEFYRFCREVQFPSLENFDVEQWPSLLYDFIAWFRQMGSLKMQ